MVYQAKLVETGEMVAIKKVLQDKRFKNRELQIMRRLEHCNIVKLMYFFYTSGEKKDEIYLGSRRTKRAMWARWFSEIQKLALALTFKCWVSMVSLTCHIFWTGLMTIREVSLMH